jgi:hypothetical protein
VKDPVARALGAAAVALALVALVVAAYAVSLLSSTREEIRALGDAIRAAMAASGADGAGGRPSTGRPPPSLDPDPD